MINGPRDNWNELKHSESTPSHLSDAHGILRPAADEVKLPELPHLYGAIGSSPAAHRLVEGVAAALAGRSTQPLGGDREQGHR